MKLGVGTEGRFGLRPQGANRLDEGETIKIQPNEALTGGLTGHRETRRRVEERVLDGGESTGKGPASARTWPVEK